MGDTIFGNKYFFLRKKYVFFLCLALRFDEMRGLVSAYGNNVVIDQILCGVLIVLKCVLLRCVIFSTEEFK